MKPALGRSGAAAPPGPADTAPAPQEPHDGTQFKGEKHLYASERIVAPETPRFANDRKALPDQPGFHITGTCPSCKHQTSAVCATEYLAHAPGRHTVEAQSLRSSGRSGPRRLLNGKRGRDQQSAEGEGEAQVTVARCACTSNHQPPPGAPPFGCGAEWLLQVHFGPGEASVTPFKKRGERDEGYLYWPAADAAAAEVPSALSTAQASAKNWAAALTSLIALSGIATLLSSRSTVETLDFKAQLSFAIFAGVAILANGMVIYQSNFAQFGSPWSIDVLRPSDLRNADLDPLIDARKSLRRLKWAILATVVSGGAALIAAGILLLASSAPTPPTSKVTYKTGAITTTTGCGTVSFASPAATSTTQPPTQLILLPHASGGKPETIPLTEVTTITAC